MRYQRAALWGARCADESAASRRGDRLAVAETGGLRDVVRPRGGGAPRTASASATRRWASSLQPRPVASYTARRTIGWRKRNLRGASVGWSSAASGDRPGRPMPRLRESAVVAASSSSNGSPTTDAASRSLRAAAQAPELLGERHRDARAELRAVDERAATGRPARRIWRLRPRAARGRRGCRRSRRRPPVRARGRRRSRASASTSGSRRGRSSMHSSCRCVRSDRARSRDAGAPDACGARAPPARVRAAGGAGARPRGRSTPGRPSGGRRAGGREPARQRARRGGPGWLGAPGSARRGRLRRAPYRRGTWGTCARARLPTRRRGSRASRGPALEVLVERVDEDPVRQVALELRGATEEHEPAAVLGAPPELGEQRGLADPRVARDLKGERAADAGRVERALDDRELVGPPDQRTATHRPLSLQGIRA